MTSIHDNWLAALRETVLLVHKTREIVAVAGDTNTLFGCVPDDLVGTDWLTFIRNYANEQVVEGLYWAVESAFEGYLHQRFLPRFVLFRDNIVADLAYPDQETIVVRLKASPVEKINRLLYIDLRHSLSSAVGFTDVLLKGIGGPLSDIQLDDLKVIDNDAHFALELVEDAHRQFILPYLSSPVPISAYELLRMDENALPMRRFKSHGLRLEYNISLDVAVYSNGAIRQALIEVVKSLPQYVSKQSQISIHTQQSGEWLEVYLTYRATQNSMKAAQTLEPVDLFERGSIKDASLLKKVLSSLHAQLAPYGCTAWALPTESTSLATIVMNVPIWHGPMDKQL